MTERRIIALEGGLAAEIYDELDSTNAEALRRIRAGTARDEWIVATRQTAGRGRKGRSWISEEGNLFATRLLRANCPRSRAAQLSFVAGLATHDAVVLAVSETPDVRCKWPNDVLINDRKVAGLLLETEGSGDLAEWVAIGIGINVVHAPDDVIFPATSIAAEDGKTSAEDVLRHLNERMEFWVGKWRKQGFSAVREAWRNVAAHLGQTISVQADGERITGRFADIDEHGALILQMADGETRKITAGDVFF
ncbi:MAG: biotin--[acetyl-CoA-carboxylase] ligase [Alphaproteobacteria bacterium]|nr:MAG: biotin--[acetyl-CoA-carboxylase] ligase [Alphaproteobacteria bacterium]